MGKAEKKITVRALLTGMVVAAAIGAGAAYENLMISGSPMTFDYSAAAALFFFTLVVLIVNPILRLTNRSWAFDRGELATIYIMGMIACMLPTNGLVGKLISGISGGIYYATLENNWAHLVTPYVKHWLIVTDPDALKGFYEGLSGKEAIPWNVWLTPLFSWMLLLIGVFGTVTALMILLRKQWIVNERLLFPLVQVPIAMIGEKEGDTEGWIAPFFKSRAVWLGVLIPLVINSELAIHEYYPLIPEWVPIFLHVRLLNDAITIPWTWNYACIGFSYLLTTKLSFSLWFLGLMTIIEDVLFTRIGFVSGDVVFPNTTSSVYPAYQGFGALLMFSLVLLWTARRHLCEVVRLAWKGSSTTSDQEEILSYRPTCLLLIGSLILMGIWLWSSGLSWWFVFPMIVVSFLAMLGLTRIVAEGGLAVTLLPMMPNEAIVKVLGGSVLGPTNVAALGFTIPWAGEMRTSVMSAFMHGLKLSEIHVTGQRRRLVVAMVIAVVTSMLCATVTTLVLGYYHGGINLSGWFFGDGAAGAVYKFITYHYTTKVRWDTLSFLGLGAIAQLLLTVAYQRFSWWPLHPLSFPIGPIWCTQQMMPSLFVAWLTKVAVLHYGGVRLYTRTKPFFLGMILGQYLSGGLWVVIDGFTGMQGNYLFFW
ncbi:MAG: hypothetical protein HY709_07320 [Candidatus Latescibacteria bacterium]|nr:hypothetical protein [Candidatus Latescibacterota bacterium]